jgi:acyl-[acyl-carrier-protein]-phospholipid O-acyltransferase / long-chain-fatty-acid--[acyl-carrier-protein] ligase
MLKHNLHTNHSPMTPPPNWLTLPRKFLRMCRANMHRSKVADSTGAELTGADLLIRTLILRRLLRRHVLTEGEQFVGLLLPPCVPAAVANATLAIDGRVGVNLNYTLSAEVLNDCAGQLGIKHVLTSRKVLEKFSFAINAEWVFLEDFKDLATPADKIACAAAAWAMPIPLLEQRLGLTKIKPDDLMTVIFTSGSTGKPKGVMLTQYNVGSNVDAVDEALHLRVDDVLAGILPIFHSFGYTVALWAPLALPPKGVYHFSPLEAREVGKLCRKHRATIMVVTATFLRSYLRRCEKEDFASLELIIAGAERLPRDLADAFEAKFGIRPLEGYGATELSPAVAANIPASRGASPEYVGVKEGTVGRPLPGVRAKIVDLDTGKDLGPNRSGMLLVTGPNVMKGYYGRPDLTADVLRDGWYVTGDVAEIDEEGFIRITGRVSRFSKLGGEMVPHLRVEEAINHALRLDEDELHLAVTAVPDPKKGERLVVLHTGLPQPPEDICRALAQSGLPPLWIPSPDSFRQVLELPVLGTGKLDLKRIKDLAAEVFCSPRE